MADQSIIVAGLRHSPLRCRYVGVDRRGFEEYEVEVETDLSRIDGTFIYVPLGHLHSIFDAFGTPVQIDDDGAAEVFMAIHECRKAGGKKPT